MRGSQVQIVDRYAIFDEVASGGMASVHLGRLVGSGGFSRTVAIKRMHRHIASDPEFVSMFQDEARIVARIRHPNVVPTLDIVSTDEELFLVMEYVHGESLHRLMKRKGQKGLQPTPAPIAAAIMVGVLRGLQAAHEATSETGEPLGIVHRDVSPQNIMVGVDGAARLLDFGVAKARGKAHATAAGQLKGKFAYMSPEQSETGQVDSRSDVFAAGVVLWELICGQRLFEADNEALVLQRVKRGNVAPPSSVNPALIPFDDIVRRAVAMNPDDRFPTAEIMARTLENAVPVASASEVSDWVKENAARALEKRAIIVQLIEQASVEQLRAAAEARFTLPSWSGAVDSVPPPPTAESGTPISAPNFLTPSHLGTPISHPSQVSAPTKFTLTTPPPTQPLPARQLVAVATGVASAMALVTLLVLILARDTESEGAAPAAGAPTTPVVKTTSPAPTAVAPAAAPKANGADAANAEATSDGVGGSADEADDENADDGQDQEAASAKKQAPGPMPVDSSAPSKPEGTSSGHPKPPTDYGF